MEEKKIGFDTGFFIKVLQNNYTAIKIWKLIKNKKALGYISILTFFELRKLHLKGIIDKNSFDIILNDINESCNTIYIIEEHIVETAARISHGSNIPAIDALIISSFAFMKIQEIYTTDSHFKKYNKKEISVKIL
jgi:predicted nucleic acid-binding protein